MKYICDAVNCQNFADHYFIDKPLLYPILIAWCDHCHKLAKDMNNIPECWVSLTEKQYSRYRRTDVLK